ncbi:hypothetical protein SAMN04488103_10845 [Gemmobacter aquatilis]|uniref:DUF2125 domain-containing protein n=1 Tax=Gemmobacter aquatilis TaxID=933059 RepID=A0A1H8JMB1_9RHOB|nr:DUF2125 domain-containing protein [Gemmobacter aquatilis]SEN81789.1 hypothetical protein SAMN04488103_10845 [Gemmobacter aquatilis]
MAQWKFMCTTAFVALVAGNAALADVTPEEVWANWKDMATSAGETLTVASEGRDGDTLVVSGFKLVSGDTTADATITIDQIDLTDNGDGSVDVTLSNSYPLVIRAAGEVGKPDVTTKVSISHPDLTITVSGSAAEMRYDFEGPSLLVKFEGVEGADATEVPNDLVAELVMTALSGNYIVAGAADAKAISSSMSADSLSMVIKGTNPEDQSKIDAKIDLSALTGTSTAKTVADMADLAAALKAGLTAEGNFAYAAATMNMLVTDAKGDTKLSSSASGGEINFAMDASRLSYGGAARDVSATMSGPEIPFPQLNLAYKEGAFNFLMPVSKSDKPADFGLMLKLAGLTVSEEIWSMFDPGKQLARDPMTLVIDTKGTATLNVDLMDEASMTALGDDAPGELNSLNVSALQLTAAGADITGSGALTFDNTDMTTYEGFPAPTGTVSLKGVGVNGLLDKLMAMGLVPEDQMMGARMMLGMFAKVVEGEPDTMTSTLEFKDKHFFANGMQLQ